MCHTKDCPYFGAPICPKPDKFCAMKVQVAKQTVHCLDAIYSAEYEAFKRTW